MKLIARLVSVVIGFGIAGHVHSEDWKCRVLPIKKNVIIASKSGIGGHFCIKFRKMRDHTPVAVRLYKYEFGASNRSKTFFKTEKLKYDFGNRTDYCFKTNGIDVDVKVGHVYEPVAACYIWKDGLISEAALKDLIGRL